MKAVITGASSGLGAEFARQMDSMGYSTVLAARRKDRLESVAARLQNPCTLFPCDLTKEEDCRALFAAHPDADVLINNAGLGNFGAFDAVSAEDDMRLLKTNVLAAHLLFKLYVCAMKERGSGRILNLASAAAFMPGPYFAPYYASKAYILRLTQSVARELKGTGVTVAALCPGSVSTEFNTVAKTASSSKPISPRECVAAGLKGLFAGKTVIVPTFKMKAGRVLSKLLPDNALTEFSYLVQRRR